MGEIYRGSTPINTFETDTDLRDAEVILITYSQQKDFSLSCKDDDNQNVLFSKTKDDLEEITEDSLSVKLTQKETLMFDSSLPVEMQIRTKFADGSAPVSNIMETTVGRILYDGEI